MQTEHTYATDRIAAIHAPEQEGPALKIHMAAGLSTCNQLYAGPGGNLHIIYLAPEKAEDGNYRSVQYELLQSDPDKLGQNIMIRFDYINKRLAKPLFNGTVKYKMPKGQNVPVFFTLPVIDAYSSGRALPVLVLTEGPLKAYALALRGVPALGMNGIWGHWVKATGRLHPDLELIIKECGVKHLVLCQDADCREISTKHLGLTDKPLDARPRDFMKCIERLKECCTEFQGLTPWFYTQPEEGPKGIDDLLASLDADAGKAAINELLSPETGTGAFIKLNLKSAYISTLKDFFNLRSAEAFYDRWGETIGEYAFAFDKGDQYKWDTSKSDSGKLELVLPFAIAGYCRVGNDYYELIKKRVKKKEVDGKLLEELEWVREKRNIGTIQMDLKIEGHKEDMLLKIPVYKGYANEPDFINYKQDILVGEHYKYLNLTYPLEHEPQPGDWSNIKMYLEHVFHNGGDNKYDVGLDMIQMYYTMPTQRQRILVLLSKDRETGKSSFVFLMRKIFGQNMMSISNNDVQSQFNPWVTKSLIAVDEGKITDPAAVEKIKSLITNDMVTMNDKNASLVEVQNHMKMIMTTNHINDFVAIDEEENRWFVLTVGKIDKSRLIGNLLDLMVEEIPAFLYYLKNRRLVHYCTKSRFAIPDEVCETEALKAVKASSKSYIAQRVERFVIDYFNDFGSRLKEDNFRMNAKGLFAALFPTGSSTRDEHDLKNCMENEFGMFLSKHSTSWKQYRFKPESVVVSYSDDEIIELEIEPYDASGKYYVFEKAKFIKPERIKA
ncbi:MAG: DUF5906 domain-containing protein [Bacteroidota bacterium]